MSISRLSFSNLQAQAFSPFFQQNWKKIALLVGGVVLACIARMVYSKFSPPSKDPKKTATPLNPPPANPIPNRTSPPATQEQQGPTILTRSSTTAGNQEKKPCSFQMFLKTLTGKTITTELISTQTLIDFVSNVTQKLNPQSNPMGPSYHGVWIIVMGKILNTAAAEYLTMGELNDYYQFQKINTLHIILNKMNPDAVSTCYSLLQKQKEAINQICFFDGEVREAEDKEKALQTFQTAIHSYCDRIMRGKFSTASNPALETLKTMFSTIISELPEKATSIKKYFNSLLDKVSIASTLFQKSYDSLLQEIDKKIKTMPYPTRESGSSFSVRLKNCFYPFSSLDTLAQHSDYFNAFKHMNPSLNCIIDAGTDQRIDEGICAALKSALSYLQGNAIDLSEPYSLLQAALFLQIPRLVLMCEKALIEAVQDDPANINMQDFTDSDLRLLKVQAPYFYQALNLAGKIQENQV